VWAAFLAAILVASPTRVVASVSPRPNTLLRLEMAISPLQFLVLVAAQSVVLTWVHNGTRGSVLLVNLKHGASNSFVGFMAPVVFGSAAYGQFWLLMAAIWWVVVLAVIALTGMAKERAPSIETTETATSGVRWSRRSG